MTMIDKIIRSKRKTLAIIVEADGKVTVRAPLKLSRERIEELVAQKSGWVQKRRQSLIKNSVRRETHSYAAGELFEYLGNVYPLEIVDRLSPRLALENDRFRLSRSSLPAAPRVFEAWYRQAAHQHIVARIQVLSKQYGYSVESIRITAAKTRWGSCGANANLNFTWRLIMAPAAAVDYVIVHELVHLEIRNHSRQFWEKVRQYCPDYVQQRLWLKENAWLLK